MLPNVNEDAVWLILSFIQDRQNSSTVDEFAGGKLAGEPSRSQGLQVAG
jgi:hypothetical protein